MITMDKQYTTRDGREVRLLMTDAGGELTIIGAVQAYGDAGTWIACYWDKDGKHASIGDSDLIEKPKTVKVSFWVNVYPDRTPGVWESKDLANRGGSSDRIACIHIEREVTEGEGL